jgi:Ulp1 family protease
VTSRIRNSTHLWLHSNVIDAGIELLRQREVAKGDHSIKIFLANTSLCYYLSIGDVDDLDRIISNWNIRAFEYTHILIPCNISNSHWILFLVSISEKTVFSLDSMGQNCSRLARGIFNWLRKESLYSTVCFDRKEWKYATMRVQIQSNGVDCGVHVLKNARCLCDNMNVEHESGGISMNEERKRWAVALLKGTLSDTSELAKSDAVDLSGSSESKYRSMLHDEHAVVDLCVENMIVDLSSDECEMI